MYLAHTSSNHTTGSNPTNISSGCPVLMGNNICGESNSLDIMKDFNRLYKDRMEQVECEAGENTLQEKIKLQQEWVRNLTQQNEMLVRAVQELEYEATDRVQQLEEKLQKSAQCLCEVMKKYREHDFVADLLAEPLQKISHLEDDMRNVLEFIRRIRENCKWNLDGLFFYTITARDLLGTKCEYANKFTNEDSPEEKELLQNQEQTIQEMMHCNCGNLNKIVDELELRTTECEMLKQTTSDSERELMSLQVKIQKLESENIILKQTLTLDKTHIEQLDEQFKSFLQDRDELKLKNKMLEKGSKSVLKEKESLICRCEALNFEIHRLKDENESLQQEVAVTRTELEALNCKPALCKKNLMELEHGNNKTTEDIFSLNKENSSLSKNTDELRLRSELTSSISQEEVGKLNDTIKHLKGDLEKSRRARDEEEQSHQREISSLNEAITSLKTMLKDSKEKDQKVQADLKENDVELVKALDDTKSKMKVEIDKRNSEIRHLKNTINELESALKTCEARATNLHEAVGLYSNSISVLEASEETAKLQMEQQKVTISNLQQALVDTKQEVDEMRKKTQDNDMKRQEILTLLELTVRDVEEENDLIKKQNEKINREHETLQELNFSLEIEHCDSLQDMDTLENQLKKYQYLFNVNEEQMKNLSKQKRCYEEVIAYFKHEMGLMADQLTNLQELLTLSNESAQQESSKVMQAFLEVQTLNEKLSSQLCACEQKVQLENQLNQLNETKICELQQLLTQRELDISKHDEDVLNIRKTLSDSLRQNKDLQTTIVELNETIENLQCSVKEYERETCTSKKNCAELQNQIDNYCGKLEDLTRKLSEKTEECLKLKIDYDNEKRALKTAQRRLQEAKHHKEQNHNDLVDSLEDFKQKLTLCDDSNSVLTQGWENLLSQLANLSCKTAVEDLNIKRNRSDPKLEDVCLGCPCVMEFYHKLMDILKRSVTELKKKLSDAQQKNKTLEEEAKTKDSQITDLKKIQEELDHQLSQNTKNDKKIADLQFEIDHLTQELQVKSLQMDKVRKSVNEINGSKCIQLACAQEEISNLRSDLANILEREYALNQKTADLRAQNDKLHCVVNCLNEKNKMFEDKEDQYLLKIKNLNTEKDTLIRKNKELLSELRTVQSMTYSTNKQQSDILSMHQKSLPNQSGRTNRSPYGQMCASPCSLGSQGTASVYDVESPPPSLDFGDNNQWYSHTFQVESENESEDCYCVGTLENLTQQMRRSNKIWMDEKRSVKECNDVKQIK
ncbi:restin homolog isoform X3 [Euwallacea fornicatus]|uniref:restin homolog isoform X3 n=1 Tax=Euwallacea fornicatus TaxID=995702 RepID=UPI00338DEDE1